MAVALPLAALAFGLVLANRPPGALLAGGAVLEALLIGFLIGGLVQMAGSHREFARAEFVMYLLACVAIPPAAAAARARRAGHQHLRRRRQDQRPCDGFEAVHGREDLTQLRMPGFPACTAAGRGTP
jgi:hypothetical protein